jgi:hypothetical protein
MRRATAALLAALPLLSACGGGKAALKTDDSAAYEAVKGRAAVAHGDAPAPARGERAAMAEQKTALAEASNQVEVRKGRVLGQDADGCTWVEGEASVAVGEQDSRHQARAAAIEQARAAAVQDFLGVEVKSKFMDFQQEGLRKNTSLTESILQTTRSGRILKEQVTAEGYENAPGCPGCRYRVALKACVVPRETGGDKEFHAELELNRVRFVQGDEAKISVTSTRDGYLYLYNVYDLGASDKTTLVVPDATGVERRVKGGEAWEYPDAEARKAGIRLLAELPKATDEVSAETIRVVVTKTPLPKSVYDPADGGYLGVMRRLHRGQTEWAEDAEAFTIYKK